MCFSATASFATAVVLLPMGLRAFGLGLGRDPRRWLPVSLTPLLFTAQQTLEGLVWLTLDQVLPGWLLRPAALAYLGFAFAVWPVWMPWCALRLVAGQGSRALRLLLRLCWGIGALMASQLWIPLLLEPGLLEPIVRHGSIDYRAELPVASLLGHLPLTLLYLVIVCLPLLLTPSRRLRWLALGLALAFALAQLAFVFAFSSVWCYFSALLSALVVWVLGEELRPAWCSTGLSEA